jgi:hypothetical protein
MCIWNGIQIWPIDAILHNFKENPRELPSICMHPRGATISVCEHVLRDAYDKKIITIKVGETYALSAKIGQSNLVNWTIRFY